jgi:PHP family Zn ribbon phosphoesterase
MVHDGAGLKEYVVDLHVHTVLSPCASVEMIPPLIVRQALEREIDVIAITDHNASANVRAVQKAALGTDLTVLPGMELQTHEEVHVLCLFDTLAQLEAWQKVVDAHLPLLENTPEFLGEQFVVDETGDLIRREMRLLAASAEIPFEEAVAGVTDLGGLAIPAHVDRPLFSLIASLGFVPEGVALGALEVSLCCTPAAARARFPQLAGFPLVRGSDAHCLDDLWPTAVFSLAAPTAAEIGLALSGRDGRSYRVLLGVTRRD